MPQNFLLFNKNASHTNSFIAKTTKILCNFNINSINIKLI